MNVETASSDEKCSICGGPFFITEQVKPDGNGGLRHPYKCGFELDGFKVQRRAQRQPSE